MYPQHPPLSSILKIGTPESHQGQEYYITLLSAVRSDQRLLKNDEKSNLGFVACKERINVAISRARSLLIIFGHAETLKRNEYWRKLIETCKEKSTYVRKSLKK